MRRKSKLRNLTWLDWIKIIIAIDITANGIGLMFGIPFHIFANIFGWFSQIIFGLLYLFIAFLMLARTLYTRRIIDEKIEFDTVTHFEDRRFLIRIFRLGKNMLIVFFKKVEAFSKVIIDKFDELLDIIEAFFEKRKVELKEEVKTIIHEDREE